jgi:hypothetical protein
MESQVTNEGGTSTAEIDDLLHVVGESMKDFFVDRRGAELEHGKAMLSAEDTVVAIRVLTSLTGALLKRVSLETRKDVALATLRVLARHAGFVGTIEDLVEAEVH